MTIAKILSKHSVDRTANFKHLLSVCPRAISKISSKRRTIYRMRMMGSREFTVALDRMSRVYVG